MIHARTCTDGIPLRGAELGHRKDNLHIAIAHLYYLNGKDSVLVGIDSANRNASSLQ